MFKIIILVLIFDLLISCLTEGNFIFFYLLCNRIKVIREIIRLVTIILSAMQYNFNMIEKFYYQKINVF